MPASPVAAASAASAAQPAGDVVRWAVFGCVLAPVVLVAYGASLGGAAGTALGLAAVTAVCRMLLRRAERAAAAGVSGFRTRCTRQDHGRISPGNPAGTSREDDGFARTHP